MRHFRSILYALVLAPAVWVLVGVGLTHDLTARGRDGFAVESLTGLLLLVLGGAAYGILVFAPISPAGPFLAGLVFLVVGVRAIEAPSDYAGVWPAGVTKPGFDLSRPGYGLAALLAVPLIMTVLSARRWAKYEPPVLPIIGQIGRARGAVPAPGMPIAVAETAVIPNRSFIVGLATETERTAVLRMPVETANTTAVVVTSPEEPTAVVVDVSAGEPTAVVVDVSAGDPTVVVVEASEEETTEAVVAGVGSDASGDEKTEAVVVEEGQTEDVAKAIGAGETAEDVVEEPGADEPAVAVVEEPVVEEPVVEEPAEDEPTEAALEEPAEPAAEDRSPDETDAAVAEASDEDEDGDGDEDGDETAASPADETTTVVTPVNGAAPAEAEPDQAEAETAPAEKAAPGDDERTQVLRLPARTSSPDEGTEKTQAIRLPAGAEPTQALTVPAAANGDKTQVLRLPTDETTQFFGLPGDRGRQAPRAGDETQVIRMSGGRADSERTQVIRPGLVTPPGETTEVAKLPAPGESTTASIDRAEPTPPPSIAGAERPNFAEDPTGRLVPPAPVSDEPSRTMTVMNLERPPDEIPTQRRPSEDED